MGLDLKQLSSVKGDALLLVDGHPTRIATAWINDWDIVKLPVGDRGVAPWCCEDVVQPPSQHVTTPFATPTTPTTGCCTREK
ncbi:hypothetical protein KFU94_41715 [Chloroflexi bacterium TSY]|nr:hypothetical protein [Chloroflexi bacterium TSY]